MTDAYVWDLETSEPRIAGRAETRQILEEIDTVFRQQVRHLVYSHKVSSCTWLESPASKQPHLTICWHTIVLFAISTKRSNEYRMYGHATYGVQ